MMEFTIDFVRMFSIGLFYTAPILMFLIAMIIILGQRVGKREAWSRSDALYYSFITATTVGYGDFHPETKAGKFLAVAIAFIGLLLTGIMVAVGLKAATVAFEHIYNLPIPK